MKPRPSKLDQFAGPLLEMNDQGKTLEEIQAWLKSEGVSAGRSTVGAYLEQLRSRRLQDRLLDSITSGASQVKEVEQKFAKNAAPELDTLIKLHRVLILQMSTQGNVNPDMLRLADQLLRTAMEYVSGQTKARQKERELKLAEEKFQFDAAKACLAKLPELKLVSEKRISDTEKIQSIKELLFLKE